VGYEWPSWALLALRAIEQLPPRGAAVMVVRSLRLPVELDQRVKAAAEKRRVPTSTLSGSGSSWS
jgi:hypothetical protein